MKYVRLESTDKFKGDERFVFGLAPVTHAELAAVWAELGYEPVSAGFLIIDPLAPNGCRVVGDSFSLKLKPLPQDAEIIGFLYGATIRMAEPTTPPLSTPAAHRPGDDAIMP